MLRMTPLPARHDPRRFRSASNCFLRWFVLVAVPLPRVYFPPTYAMHFAVGCALISSVGAATTPEASAKRPFDLPAGEAAAVFKHFIAPLSRSLACKGAIGYWGKQQVPSVITEYDPYRPLYDRAHLYVDGFAGYRTRLFRDKVGATFQFNVRDLTEGGRLQPIVADPDGSIAAWRIVSRRQFIFTTTFDF
jgi:hypothetical protein